MQIKDYIKHIKNEIMTAGNYCCESKAYKKDGKADKAQMFHKLAIEGVNRVETLFRLLDDCIAEKHKEQGDKIYKELYDECIEVMLEEHRDIESKLKSQ